MQMILGRRLRWIRIQRGLSRKLVALRLGLPVTLVEQHEQGTARLQPRQVMAYARFYDVRISFLFCDPPAAAASA
jgi:transcriptional regulator with XRE-family HTH domain